MGEMKKEANINLPTIEGMCLSKNKKNDKEEISRKKGWKMSNKKFIPYKNLKSKNK